MKIAQLIACFVACDIVCLISKGARFKVQDLGIHKMLLLSITEVNIIEQFVLYRKFRPKNVLSNLNLTSTQTIHSTVYQYVQPLVQISEVFYSEWGVELWSNKTLKLTECSLEHKVSWVFKIFHFTLLRLHVCFRK